MNRLRTEFLLRLLTVKLCMFWWKLVYPLISPFRDNKYAANTSIGLIGSQASTQVEPDDSVS
jgi:hypothetical protein